MIKGIQEKKFDFIIVGSGFGGAILAMCLNQTGKQVLLVEKQSHPRFTVGESSTPIADMILRDLADRYSLPFLQHISRYGEWQRNYPDVLCGLKRGFSYYLHQKGDHFQGSREHHNECLVAASLNDENSDTNWLRSDVDHFFIKKAQEIGVEFLDMTEVISLDRDEKRQIWEAELKRGAEQTTMEFSWVIDATGSPAFSNRFFGVESSSDLFKTDSEAIYSHFEEVGRWDQWLRSKNRYTDDYPYSPDDSALHQLIDEGWIWMLRFKTGLLSAGVVLNRKRGVLNDGNPREFWNKILDSYPSLKELFANATISGVPGKILTTGRLQRRLERAWGRGWLAMNHTVGFVDPLHSTGIAYTLSGIEKLMKIFEVMPDPAEVEPLLQKYETALTTELEFIDTLVACCYEAGSDFRLFTAAVMLYFTATVEYEQSRLKGENPSHFLCSNRPRFHEIAEETYFDLKKLGADATDRQVKNFVETVRERIRPFNSVGLMDPKKNNMYSHTAVSL